MHREALGGLGLRREVTPSWRRVVTLRSPPAAAPLRVRAVIQEPYGVEGGTGSGSRAVSGGAGGGSAGGAGDQRRSGFRLPRRRRRASAGPAAAPTGCGPCGTGSVPGAGAGAGAGAAGDDVIELNVGGRLMQTTRSTLLALPGSRLAAMFRGGAGGEGRLRRDSAGRVLLDLDPGLFGLALEYLGRLRGGGGRGGARVPGGRERGVSAAAPQPSQPQGEADGIRLAPPPCRAAAASRAVSQLFYISTGFCEARGLRVAVHTEDDIRSAAASPSPSSQQGSGGGAGAGAGFGSQAFDMFVDATYSEAQLSLTFVARRELAPGGVFLGLTSRAHLDRKGSQIPCYGWKSDGCTYNDHTGGGRLGGSGGSGAVAVGTGLGLGLSGLGDGLAAGRNSAGAHCGSAPLSPPQLPLTAGAGAGAGGFNGSSGAPAHAGPSAASSSGQPLWRKGDSVELILRQGQSANQLLLKVNGRAVDVINSLPPLRNWSWYVGLWAGGDVSCAVFQRDQYSVYWGDYSVKRYL
ncbi:hypothetical protein GPECTOR_59g627 [Gonium pectorale]|uniref:Potassium channel tetramerisation-type BTB domain-containing protein n=1 Tax=Gonium pectorale TaxID=33097 RepID=A0A150G6Q7_GONPE|nr:hypothetical protein GPECTOR_59g627 [Gonium pectorale]|eukprot:KXZ45020.1 hypothetical protein GPECTOR_59g627 [Gonium pectorale]